MDLTAQLCEMVFIKIIEANKKYLFSRYLHDNFLAIHIEGLRMNRLTLLTALILSPNLAIAAINTASWVSWSGTTGTFDQNGDSVTVSYSGQYNWIDHDSLIFNEVPTSFTNSSVTNTPGSNGTIAMTGGSSEINNFHFSQAVVDPLIAIWSVGAPDVSVMFNFNSPFTILSSGGGHWGDGTLTQTGNSITGLEGNGLLQLKGTFNDISFTTPNYEYYYGITVGGITSAVPEPETYTMLLVGMSMLGFSVYRKNKI